MARKTWIKVRRGILDSKHTDALGAAWYLFFYILDQADWETGKIIGWKDQFAADELGKTLSLIRYHRQHLQNKEYIICEKRKTDQIITVNRWKDPRQSDFDNDESTQNCEVLDDESTQNSLLLHPRVEQELSKSRARVEQELSKTFNDPSIKLHSSSSHIPYNTVNISNNNNIPNRLPLYDLLLNHFSEYSQLKIPDDKNSKIFFSDWFEPVSNMMESSELDIELTKSLISKSIDMLTGKYSINSPKSILKTFISLIAENKRVKKRDNSMEFRADEFLAEEK
jgi:hypothetical protein